VVILASNLRANMDEAFTRRFQSMIHFPMPKEKERKRLWERAFSEKTQLEGKIKVEEIASRFELSGGSIMNVVRYATLMALRKNTLTIRDEDLVDGIRKELQKEGRTA
jgi:ATP-dependent 26S proteasome regulatory subunit